MFVHDINICIDNWIWWNLSVWVSSNMSFHVAVHGVGKLMHAAETLCKDGWTGEPSGSESNLSAPLPAHHLNRRSRWHTSGLQLGYTKHFEEQSHQTWWIGKGHQESAKNWFRIFMDSGWLGLGNHLPLSSHCNNCLALTLTCQLYK